MKGSSKMTLQAVLMINMGIEIASGHFLDTTLGMTLERLLALAKKTGEDPLNPSLTKERGEMDRGSSIMWHRICPMKRRGKHVKKKGQIVRWIAVLQITVPASRA